MITPKDIKAVFANIPKGKNMHISEIQDYVGSKIKLTADDKKPYVTTRKTDYPVWKHKIQKVLFEYKMQGKIKHDESTNSYTF